MPSGKFFRIDFFSPRVLSSGVKLGFHGSYWLAVHLGRRYSPWSGLRVLLFRKAFFIISNQQCFIFLPSAEVIPVALSLLSAPQTHRPHISQPRCVVSEFLVKKFFRDYSSGKPIGSTMISIEGKTLWNCSQSFFTRNRYSSANSWEKNSPSVGVLRDVAFHVNFYFCFCSSFLSNAQVQQTP